VLLPRLALWWAEPGGESGDGRGDSAPLKPANTRLLSQHTSAGEQRKPPWIGRRETAGHGPSTATRAPVVLLNGMGNLYTNACPVSADSTVPWQPAQY